jgi:hypothetical protein
LKPINLITLSKRDELNIFNLWDTISLAPELLLGGNILIFLLRHKNDKKLNLIIATKVLDLCFRTGRCVAIYRGPRPWLKPVKKVSNFVTLLDSSQ